MAQGSNVQWQRFIAIPKFAGLASEKRENNNGRLEDRVRLHAEIAEIMAHHTTAELIADLAAATIPHAPINAIPDVQQMPALKDKLTRTTMPDGKTVRMQPMAVDVASGKTELAFPAKYGEHTGTILAEIGYSADDLTSLRSAGVIPN